MRLYLLIIVILSFFLSCNNTENTSTKNEGVITYDITYLEADKISTMIELLPSEMTMKFKENSTKIYMGLGIFNTAYISKASDDSSSILLQIMYAKYHYKEHRNDSSILFTDMPGLQIEYTDETKEIAGYKCKRANIKYDGYGGENFSVYYTDQININNPNRNNPFRDINGVLLEFQLVLLDLNMKFTANNVENIQVPPEEFEPSVEFENAEKEKMEETLNSLKLMLM